MRTDKNKSLLLDYLRKTPIIQIACEKSGISRATYYRWCNDSKKFKQAADEAIREGELFVNDLSESQVLSLIKDKNWQAIQFWLRNNSPKYADKIKVEANIKQLTEKLTPEQEKVVREALRLAALSDSDVSNQNENETDNK